MPILGSPTHRAWNWADEQGHKRCFVLPIAELNKWTRDAGNPIFDVGVAGKFDDYGVHHCNVVYVKPYYYMFYGGVAAAAPYPEYIKGIGVARATSPLGPFTRLNSGDPIVNPPAGEGCSIPSVIYDTLESDPNKRWKMFYEVFPTAATYALWYDYSPDPVTGWGVNQAATNMAIGSWGPSVMRVGNSYWGLSPTAAPIDIQFSTCPVDNPLAGWTNHGVVIARGGGGAWDVSAVRYVTMTYIQGLFYAFYSGDNGAGVLRVGMAASGSDLGFAWTKWGRNYVLDRGVFGAWDRRYIFAPSIIQVEDTYYMYYTGAPDADAWERKIGVATIP